MKITTVGGTSSIHDAGWWKYGSPFLLYLETLGVTRLKKEDFIWSTDLDGFNILSYLFRSSRRHTDWEAGGAALRYYLEDVPVLDRNIISHSHGRQVVLYAISQGLLLNSWIDVSGPVRVDMLELAKAYECNIKLNPIHIYSYLDPIQIAGSLLDGKFGIKFKCPISCNIKLPHEVGHSKLLYTPEYFHLFGDIIKEIK